MGLTEFLPRTVLVALRTHIAIAAARPDELTLF